MSQIKIHFLKHQEWKSQQNFTINIHYTYGVDYVQTSVYKSLFT